MQFVHEQPAGRYRFGAGTRGEIGPELQRLDVERALFISGSRDSPLTDELRSTSGTQSEAFVGVRPHVPTEDVDAVLAVADEFGADSVVSLGGGSATGLAKMVALHRDVRLVAIPTTYAGSEMTPIWGTTAEGHKTTGRSDRVVPDVVIYDPELTLTLPKSVSVNSAFNALAHCAEALWLPSTSPICASDALTAVEAILAGVQRVATDTADMEAREQLLYGAHRAGAVLASAGTGVLHSAAHVLGGRHNLDHGALYAVLTPAFLGWQMSVADDAIRIRLEKAFGAEPDGLDRLARRLGAPMTLTDLGFPEGEVAEAAAEAAARSDSEPADLEDLFSNLLGPSLPAAKETP